MHTLYLNAEKDGVLVTGLGPENFRLYVNGQSHPFHLEKIPAPTSMALLLEYSTASWPGFQDLNTSIRGFLQHAPQDNSYALAVYSRFLLVAFEFTSEVSRLPDAYAAMGSPLWGDINTYDAVYGMLDRLGQLPGRRILVLIGSGVDTRSGHTVEDVKRKIEAENVTVFAIGSESLFPKVYGAAVGPPARSFLEMLANESGGGAWFPSQTAEVPAILDDILRRIAAQYCLVYESPRLPPGKFEKVTVEAFSLEQGKQNFKVRVRQAWR